MKSADFERTLAAPSRARSTHFAVHHVDGEPCVRFPPSAHKLSTALSTDAHPAEAAAVDDPPPPARTGRAWWGAVVPKRWARRAVTRNAIKRQIYQVSAAAALPLPCAAHVVRLRASFDRQKFPSASYDALKAAVRAELQQLLARAPAGP